MDRMNYVMDDPKYSFHAWWQKTKDFDDHNDHTPNWLVLREDASLKDAVAALADKGEERKYALRIGSEAEFGAEKEEILQICRGKNIMLLREEREGLFFNYCDGREYQIHEMTGWGSADDAAQIINRSLSLVYTEEEKQQAEANLQHDRKQRQLEKGKEICRKYFILSLRQLERNLAHVRKKLEEQIRKDPDPKTFRGSISQKLEVYRKQRQLRERIEELETAREYLLHKEELES